MILLLIIYLFSACKSSSIRSLKWGAYSPYNIFSMTKIEFLAPELSLFYYNCQLNTNCQFRQKVESSIDVKYIYNNGESYFLEKVFDDEFGIELEIEFSKKEFNKRQAWDATVSLLTEKNINLSFVFKVRNPEQMINIIEQERNNMIIFSFGGRNRKEHEFIKIEGEETCHFQNVSITILKIDQKDLVDVTDKYIYYKENHKNIKKKRNFIEDEENTDIFDENFIENDIKESIESEINDNNIVYFDFSMDQSCIFFISYEDSEIPEFNDHAFSIRKNEQRTSFRDKVLDKFMNNQINLSPEDFQKRLFLSIETISNLLGGLTYYHGNLSTINTKINHGEKEVFCSTPSRKKFPRGFLWDEGFHLTILCKWDQFLCGFILENWLNLMDIDGWIAREQIRNVENAHNVDFRFIHQDYFEANPPTLIFGIITFISETEKNLEKLEKKEKLSKKQIFLDYITTLYKKLKLWFVWMMDTQTDINEESPYKGGNFKFSFSSKHSKSSFYDWRPKIRWHCKGECHDGNFMGSGLDDYPRETKNSKSEQHLDLAVWLCFFAENLGRVAKYIGEQKESVEYYNIFAYLKEKINEEFLDYTDFIYKDVTYNIKENEYDHNKHIGYINLFPFLFGFHQNRSEVKASFYHILVNSSLLNSPFGIRSLSKLDFYFGKGDNYWRGPIWIPLNFLILRSLKIYFADDMQGKNLYSEVKTNLEKNLIAEWERTGFLWENYCSIGGMGQREKGFTGWSALIVLIMNEDYWE